MAYGFTKYILEDAIKDMKKGVVNESSSFTRRTIVNQETKNNAIMLARDLGFELSQDQLIYMTVGDTLSQLICSSWMKNYFSLVGDSPPNKENELHLEPQTKRGIHEEYVKDMDGFDATLSYNAFLTAWRVNFKHVKIRTYKVCLIEVIINFKLIN